MILRLFCANRPHCLTSGPHDHPTDHLNITADHTRSLPATTHGGLFRYYFWVGVPVHSVIMGFIVGAMAPDDHPMFQWCQNMGLVGISAHLLGSLLVGYALYGLNVLLFRILDQYVPFLENPRRRLATQFLLAMFGNISTLAVVTKLFHWAIGIPITAFLTRQGVVVAFLLSGLITAGYTGLYFLNNWLRQLEQQDELERRIMQWQLDALRAQLDPHFLFNSLTTLSALVAEGDATAQPFIDHLARMYRYVLKHRQHDVVSVADELGFLQSYAYLLHARVDGTVVLDVDVPDEYHQSGLPPLALQLLVENAVKHNAYSMTHPLRVEIRVDGPAEDGHLIVRNQRRRRYGAERHASTGMGLDNLRQRYRLLDGRMPIISEDEMSFTVAIPLIPQQKESQA